VATTRRNPSARSSQRRPAEDTETAHESWSGPEKGEQQAGGRAAARELTSAHRVAEGDSDGAPPRLPPVRLAPREELAAAARVAPLLRAARNLARWAERRRAAGAGRPDGPAIGPDERAAAASDLELTSAEVDAALRVATATKMLRGGRLRGAEPRDDGRGAGDVLSSGDILSSGDTGQLLTAWAAALEAVLAAEDLDGLATALYTVGAPVRMEGLFDAYAAAAGTMRDQPGSTPPDQAAALSTALETLADLGVVELGTEEAGEGLTVALSPLGVWGVHRRLRAQGWHVPILGDAHRGGAAGLLATLASCDAEDGEAEITSWLARRQPAQAAAELVRAAGSGSPGLRGAAFAVLDRIGEPAIGEVRAALADPVLRAHASVWLHEHGEQAELRPEDRAWLLVDLGAGLLEEADPADVVAELLPDVPGAGQAEIVAGLWRVEHPAVTDLLTALSEHHPDPEVARAARKEAFKARSSSID